MTIKPKRKSPCAPPHNKGSGNVFACHHCGKLKRRAPSEVNHHRAVFCSRECHKESRATYVENFNAKLSPAADSGCVEWAGSVGSRGYGTFRMRGATMNASRAAWILFRGQVPDGLFVCHRCDNRRCVNVEHLFLGTHQDNMADMRQKGRGVSGKREPRIGWEKVIEIRRAKGSGSLREVALRFGVSQTTVHSIQHGRLWASVPPLPVTETP